MYNDVKGTVKLNGYNIQISLKILSLIHSVYPVDPIEKFYIFIRIKVNMYIAYILLLELTKGLFLS